MTALAFAVLLNSLPWCGDDRSAQCCIMEFVGEGWRQKRVMRRIVHDRWGGIVDTVTEPRQCLAADLHS